MRKTDEQAAKRKRVDISFRIPSLIFTTYDIPNLIIDVINEHVFQINIIFLKNHSRVWLSFKTSSKNVSKFQMILINQSLMNTSFV